MSNVDLRENAALQLADVVAWAEGLDPAVAARFWELFNAGEADRRKQANHERRFAILGLILGFLVSISALAAACYCATKGSPAAWVIGGATVVSLAAIFVLWWAPAVAGDGE